MNYMIDVVNEGDTAGKRCFVKMNKVNNEFENK